MADFRDQLKVVKGQLKKPTVRVVFSEAITDTGKTVQYFANDNAMLSVLIRSKRGESLDRLAKQKEKET